MRTAVQAAFVALSIVTAAFLSACGGGNDARSPSSGGVSPPLTLKLIRSFGGDQNDPVPASLIQGSNAAFYGVTSIGGANGEYIQQNVGENFVVVFAPNHAGSLAKFTPAGVETVLWNFGNDATDGLNPSGLVEGRDGILYGTTIGGGLDG